MVYTGLSESTRLHLRKVSSGLTMFTKFKRSVIWFKYIYGTLRVIRVHMTPPKKGFIWFNYTCCTYVYEAKKKYYQVQVHMWYKCQGTYMVHVHGSATYLFRLHVYELPITPFGSFSNTPPLDKFK